MAGLKRPGPGSGRQKVGRAGEAHALLHPALRAALHREAGPIRCVRGLKSSLVIGQKAQINPNPFTPRGRANLVI